MDNAPQEGASPDNAAPDPDSLEGQILAHLKAGRKIEAVKLCREQSGKGLKEALDVVEYVGRKYGVNPKGAGCASVLLLVLAACAVAGAVL